MRDDLTVLVSSCDKYVDLLKPFSILFRRYWPDCTYKKVLVTETAPAPNKQYIFDDTFACGKPTSWCSRLLCAAESIDTPYILLILDDFFLCSMFSNRMLEHYLDIAKRYQSGSLRLIPSPPPQQPLPEKEIGAYQKGKAYRVSAQVAIWDREYLIQLLSHTPDSELWEFERRGSFFSNEYDAPMLGTYRYVFPYTEIICGGEWISAGLIFCSRAGVKVDYHVRGTESDWRVAYRTLRGAIFKLNPTLVTKIKNIITSI